MKIGVNKSSQLDMLNSSIYSGILMFAFPLMLSGIFQLLFNAADIIVVGKFVGDRALAAVGSNGAMTKLIINLFVGLSVGTNVVCAKYIGAKQDEDIKKTIETSIGLAIFSGIFLTIVGILLSVPLLKLMLTPESVIGSAAIYLKIFFLGMPAQMIFNFGSAILRAYGDTKRPLTYLTIAGILNVLLNLFFVLVLKMDVAGVAFATIISQYLSAFLVFNFLKKEQINRGIKFNKIKVFNDKTLEIVKIGIPAGLQGIMLNISNMFIQSSINSLGDETMAAHSAVLNIEGFAYISLNAFACASLSFVSQNIGAKQYERVKSILKITILYEVVLGGIIGVISVFLGKPIVSLYTSTPTTVSYASIGLAILCGLYLLEGIMDAISSAIRGMGFSTEPMIIVMLGICVFRIIWLTTIFKIPKYHVLECIYISYPVSWVVTVLALFICYRVLFKKHFKVESKENI